MIDSKRVSEIFHNCLYRSDEIIDDKPNVPPIVVNCIKSFYGLHPDRIAFYKNEILELISELPDSFKNGDSFINLCMTNEGVLWTGLQDTMDELFGLGLAIGKMDYLFKGNSVDSKFIIVKE